MATTLGQRCTTYLDSTGVQHFQIDSSIDSVAAGDLPIFGVAPFTSYIFVHQIGAVNDPKSDTFSRVGNVADLTTLPTGRESAVAASKTTYLATEFTVRYDDVATASNAKLLIQQRVDNLIADWHTFNEKFLAPVTTPPDLSEIPFPLTSSIVSERTDAYNTAHALLLASKTATATAAGVAAVALATSTAANQDVVQALADSQSCSAMLGQFNAGFVGENAYRSAVNIFVTASSTFETAAIVYRNVVSPGPTDQATFDAAKTAFDAAKAAMQAAVTAEATNGGPVLTAFQTAIATACTAKISAVSVTTQAKATADAAAATATTEKKAADAAQSAAQDADTAALLSVKEVCPTFQATFP